MCRRPLCQKHFRVAEILGHRILNFRPSIQMARPRTPTSILEGRGAFVNHPERRDQRANEPVPSAELGNAPKHFGKEEKRIWKELVQIALPGVLCNSDRWIAETLCILMARQRAYTITNTERGQLITILSRLGMMPADRSRVAARPQKAAETETQNPWDLLQKLPN